MTTVGILMLRGLYFELFPAGEPLFCLLAQPGFYLPTPPPGTSLHRTLVSVMGKLWMLVGLRSSLPYPCPELSPCPTRTPTLTW